jgi:hypothetical protein
MGPALPELVRTRRDKAEFSSFVRQVLLRGQRDNLRKLFRESRVAEEGVVAVTELNAMLTQEPAAQSVFPILQLTALELWLRAA